MPGLSLHLVQIKKHRNKRSLSVTGHQRDQLVLDRLYPSLDLIGQPFFHDLLQPVILIDKSEFNILVADFLPDLLSAYINERRQMCQGKRLAAVLVTGNLRYDLSCNITRRIERMRFFDQRIADDRTVLEHIFQIHQITIVFLLRIIIRIMKMYDPFLMGIHDLFRQ